MTESDPISNAAAARIAAAYATAARTVWQLTGIGHDVDEAAVAAEPLKQLRAAIARMQALELALTAVADLGPAGPITYRGTTHG